jgi:MerR family transcriptional regulator, light-induced transcriptional regulator
MNGPYKIGTLSRLTGFSPILLRAWERRFSLLVPGRGEGGQRLYTDADLAVLRRVRTLMDDGRSIGEIARSGRGSLLGPPPAGQAPAHDRPAVRPAAPTDPAGRVDAWRQQLVAGALQLDAAAIAATLDDVFLALSAERAVSEILEPVAIQIGDLWKSGQCSVASEHLISSHLVRRLGRLLDAAQPSNDDAPQVVAACFPDEHHELGLLITAWQVARQGVRVSYLGASLPTSDLMRACRTRRPQAILLSVTRRPLFTRHQPALVRQFASGTMGQVYVGGQGVPARVRGRRGAIRYLHKDPLPAVVRDLLAGLAPLTALAPSGRR